MVTDNQQYKDVLNDIKLDGRFYTSSGKLNSAFLRRDYFLSSPIYKKIQDATRFLDVGATISERIYCIEHHITQRSACVCGRDLRFITNVVGYLKSCYKCVRKVSTSWKTSSDTVIKNIKHEKDDLADYLKNPHTPEATYDVVLDFIKEKNKHASECIKWVSRNNIRNDKHILKKIVGLTNYLPWSNNQYHWANRMYNILHNTHNNNNNICIVCKVNKTKFRNAIQGYSTCCAKKECVQTFGCENRVLNHITTIAPVIEQQGFDLIIDENYRGLNSGETTIKCRTCNTTLNYNLHNAGWKNIRCHVCYGDANSSFEEKTVLAFVQLHTSNVLENYKAFVGSHKEVDIYVPHKNLAVEYNGVLWHSFGTFYPNNFVAMNKNKKNHFTKYELCKQHNMKLLQVNSYEWGNKHKQNIWKSIIANCLGASKRIHARKCQVVELSATESNNFLNQNHLQGANNANVKLGLKHDDQLVAVMTFSKPRFNKKYQWELVRFCNLLNHTVVGGSSKLLKYFINKYTPQSLISYADVRYSNGDMYKKLGFEFVKYTSPSYIYIKADKILSRFATQKHRLSKLLKSFDSNKTEQQNMLDAGYRKMWDAGTMLFEYKKLNNLAQNFQQVT